MNLKLDIVYMRIWAILFIVAHHSIHIYWYWPVNTDIPALSPLFMLSLSTIFKNIGLAIFTYISGMLVFYQASKRTTYITLSQRKLKDYYFLPLFGESCITYSFLIMKVIRYQHL